LWYDCLVEKSPFILIVDDDPDDIFLLSHALMLKDTSIKIVEAYDGEAALILLENMIASLELPDLIIVDINMPVMDGRQFLTILKSKPETKDIRTLMYTSSANLFDKIHAQFLDAELIVKPSLPEKLNKLAHKLYGWATEGHKSL
jgi:CheY-like chemotaxis protein